MRIPEIERIGLLGDEETLESRSTECPSSQRNILVIAKLRYSYALPEQLHLNPIQTLRTIPLKNSKLS